MSYVDPGTFSYGELLTGSEMETIADDIRWLHDEANGGAFCGVSVSGAWYGPGSDAWSDVPWTADPVDVSLWWSGSVGDAALTVPVSAVPSGATSVVLECLAMAAFDANGTGYRALQMTQNGTRVESTVVVSGVTGDTTVVSGTFWAICAARDVLRAQLRQSSGDYLNAVVRLHVKRIGSL